MIATCFQNLEVFLWQVSFQKKDFLLHSSGISGQYVMPQAGKMFVNFAKVHLKDSTIMLEY